MDSTGLRADARRNREQLIAAAREVFATRAELVDAAYTPRVEEMARSAGPR
jgi:hypothetical protein